MDRLIPANEFPNAFLDADGGPVPELTLGAAQVRRGQPHVAGLLAVALDPHLAPQRPSDQLDQAVEPHAPPAADIDGLGEPRRPRPGGPFHGGQDAIHAIRNIGIVALARPLPGHPDRRAGGDEVGEPMDRQAGPLAGPGEEAPATAPEPPATTGGGGGGASTAARTRRPARRGTPGRSSQAASPRAGGWASARAGSALPRPGSAARPSEPMNPAAPVT